MTAARMTEAPFNLLRRSQAMLRQGTRQLRPPGDGADAEDAAAGEAEAASNYCLG